MGIGSQTFHTRVSLRNGCFWVWQRCDKLGPKFIKLCSNLRLRLKHVDWFDTEAYAQDQTNILLESEIVKKLYILDSWFMYVEEPSNFCGVWWGCITSTLSVYILLNCVSTKLDLGPSIEKPCSNPRLRFKHVDWLILSLYSGSNNQHA